MTEITKIDTFIQSSPRPAWLATTQGQCVYANPALERLTGLNSDQINRADWRSFLLEEDRAVASAFWQRSLATGTPYRLQVRVRGSDGVPECVELIAFGHKAGNDAELWLFTALDVNGGAPLRDEGGNIVKSHGVATDIEDRKPAEEALQVLSRNLQESKAKLEEAQRITHVGYWEWDIATNGIKWSDETYRIYGMRPQECRMDLATVREKIHPEDWAVVSRALEEALSSDVLYNIECRLLRPTGEVRIVDSQGHVKRDTSGRPILMFGTLQDITDRKRAEETVALMSHDLQESKTRLEDAQRIAHVGYYVWDQENDSLTWSDETYRIFGMQPQERPINVAAFQEMIHPEDREFLIRAMQEARGGGRPDIEYRIVRPSGEVRIVHSQGHVTRDVPGQPRQRFGTVQDITDRKQAEHEREKLRQLEADLAHVNRVSTLGEMSASLAHEIKQPIAAAITSANSCLEWLAHEPPDLDRARAAAARIDKYGNHAAEIIDRIRSLYKKSPPQRELVDMNGIIQEMLTLLKGEATRYPIAIRTELTTDLPKIMVDRVQLQQVFMNLMLNAIEAMKDSGGELTVKSELQDGQLQFSVCDTGVGLPQEKMDEIFSAFFTTKPQGSGMGLAISSSIVESHGGQLWATANSGGGATFHFTLPTQVTESSPLVA
jgi:PAS domain S-box-containing protein